MLQEARTLDVRMAVLDTSSIRGDLLRRVKDWRGLFRRHPQQGQWIFRKLIASRLVFEPQADSYVTFRGTATLKSLLIDGMIGGVDRASRKDRSAYTW